MGSPWDTQNPLKYRVRIFNDFLTNFGSHFGSILGQFLCTLRFIFWLIFEVCFFMIFCRFGLSFWYHFGIQNRSREPSGANRSTLDFKRRYNENQVFSPWSVRGDTPNHSQNPSQKLMVFFINFRPEKHCKMSSKSVPKC